jgi:starch synthase
MTNTLRILYLSAEVSPFAKAGGLADVAGSLPTALHALGLDVRVAMPAYGFIDRQRFGLQAASEGFTVLFAGGRYRPRLLRGTIGRHVPLFLLDSPAHFDRERIYGYEDDAQRFLFFCRGVLEGIRQTEWRPDIIHCNDWHTGAIPYWVAHNEPEDPLLAGVATVFTIHNLAYQGVFPATVWEVTGQPGPTTGDTLNLMALGIRHADAVTTVSPTYAREILTPERGEGLDDLLRERRDRLYGILNGLDTETFDPTADPALVQRFGPDNLDDRAADKRALQAEAGLSKSDSFLLGMVSRLADQKGFDILIDALERVLAEADIQFVLLGTGDHEYARRMKALADRHPQQIAIFLAFDALLAQHIYAGADAFLMPSRYEPCGLGQLIALRYGAVPIVRATGGLVDTVRDYDPASDTGSGFVFQPYTSDALEEAIRRAERVYRHDKAAWRRLQQRGMREDFSWDTSAQRYLGVYETVVGAKGA